MGKGNSLNTPASSRLDELARQQGFPDYATMKAWQDRRREKTGGTVTVKGARPVPARDRNSEAETRKKKKPVGLVDRILNGLRGNPG